MKFRLSLLYLITVLIVFGSFVLKVSAASSDSILVNIAPPNPAPNENTTITLSSYANNLDSVPISWSVNGKTVASGTGKKSFSVTAPAAGGETDVVATISLPDGAINTPITIKPSVMELLWQANDSYVPPFYRGKALPTAESEIKVVAMPEVRNGSSNVPPQNMTYAWQKDYTNNVDGSGYGKNFFTYISDYLDNSNNVSVTASTTDQKYSSDASLDIGMTQPKILFYKNDNNLGTIWEQTLADGHKIQGSEIVQVAPYFISPKELLNPTLVWGWFINDSSVSLTSFKKYLMPLQAQSGVSGTAKLRLDITSQDKIFETASQEMNVTF